MLKNVRVITHHFSDILHLNCLTIASLPHFPNGSTVDRNLLLEWTQDLSNNLPYFGLHLEPLKFLENAFLISHNKITL